MDSKGEEHGVGHDRHQQHNDTDFLHQIHHERLMTYLPIIVSVSVIAVVGIVGNCLTIRYYAAQRRKSSTATYIQYLGGIDLVVCFIAFASTGDLAVNVYFSSRILCKLLGFSSHVFVTGSVLILWIISFDRYLKVCRRAGKQFSQRWAKWVVLALMVLSFVLSISQFLVYDAVSIELHVTLPTSNWSEKSPGNQHQMNTWGGSYLTTREPDGSHGTSDTSGLTVTGHFCITSCEDHHYQMFVKISNAIDALIITTVFFTLLITYSSMLRHLSRNSNPIRSRCIEEQKEKRKRKQELIALRRMYRVRQLSENSVSTPNTNSLNTPDDENTNASFEPMSRTLSWSMVNINAYREANSTLTKRRNHISTEMNFIVMMAVVSVALVICFVPYFIVVGIRMLSETSDSEFGVLSQLALRSCFVNSVINPIVFCAFNPRYRRFICNCFAFNNNTEGVHSINFVSKKMQESTL